jgi:hypothetical protein
MMFNKAARLSSRGRQRCWPRSSWHTDPVDAHAYEAEEGLQFFCLHRLGVVQQSRPAEEGVGVAAAGGLGDGGAPGVVSSDRRSVYIGGVNNIML